MVYNSESNNFLVGGFNPFEKYYIVKMGIFPNRGEHKKYLKPPPSFWLKNDKQNFNL